MLPYDLCRRRPEKTLRFNLQVKPSFPILQLGGASFLALKASVVLQSRVLRKLTSPINVALFGEEQGEAEEQREAGSFSLRT